MKAGTKSHPSKAGADLIEVSEAARISGTSSVTIYNAINVGDLEAFAEPRMRAMGRLDGLPEELALRRVAELAGVDRTTARDAIHCGTLEARQGPDGNWWVRRDAAKLYAETRTHARRLRRSDVTVWNEQRLAKQKERAPVELKCSNCGKGFDRYSGMVRSARAYCTPDCYAAHRRASGPREQLLNQAGNCGSPTCQDRCCPVTPGGCHRNGCHKQASLARCTRRDSRYVTGKATLYCTRKCAVLARNAGQPWKEKVDLLEAAGYTYSVQKVASIVNRAEKVVIQWAGKLNLGCKVRGAGVGDPWRFSSADIDLIREATMPHNAHPQHIKASGRRSSALADRKGKRVGRPPGFTESDRSDIVQLARQGLNVTQIAGSMESLSRDQVRRILKEDLPGYSSIAHRPRGYSEPDRQHALELLGEGLTPGAIAIRSRTPGSGFADELSADQVRRIRATA
jgi:hypothetical protein